MKRIIETTDASGLETLLGEIVTLFCVNYFYRGKLVGVNDTCVELAEAGIVYDTGEWSADKYSDCQQIGGTLFVQTSAIESFGVLK